jgi:hypothetical protein
MPRMLVALVTAGAISFAVLPIAGAQTVWSGFDFSFTKLNDTNPQLPENQDRITDNVWISRGVNGGIFNVAEETEYDGVTSLSPLDTEWATDINNPSDTIVATNWAALDFDPWVTAYGGRTMGTLPANLLSLNAVVHLISDNIYLDLRFTSWTQGGPGGFAYERAAAPPGPETDGDYNDDGFVNAADYVHWRKTLGDEVPEGSGADGDGDGTIDDGDYDFWFEQFGTDVSPGSGGAVALVPEPATLPVMLLTIVFAILLRRTLP